MKILTQSILLCLSELADDATADGLLKKLKSPDWIAALHILTDVLPVLSLLSRTFQKGSINSSQIQPSNEITVASGSYSRTKQSLVSPQV